MTQFLLLIICTNYLQKQSVPSEKILSINLNYFTDNSTIVRDVKTNSDETIAQRFMLRFSYGTEKMIFILLDITLQFHGFGILKSSNNKYI